MENVKFEEQNYRQVSRANSGSKLNTFLISNGIVKDEKGATIFALIVALIIIVSAIALYNFKKPLVEDPQVNYLKAIGQYSEQTTQQ